MGIYRGFLVALRLPKLPGASTGLECDSCEDRSPMSKQLVHIRCQVIGDLILQVQNDGLPACPICLVHL